MNNVKQYYSHISEQRMYEWSLEEPTMFNRAKRQHFAFFTSVKEIDMKSLSVDELMRLTKIADLQMKEFKAPTYKKR